MKRPVISIELYTWDIWMETTAWTFLILLWIYPLQLYTSLPEQIPSHFSLDGNVDGYNSKQTILLLPIIATIINIGLLILGHYPHLFNYSTRITPQNAAQQYRMATRIVRFSRILISAIFILLVYKIIASTQSVEDALGKDYMPWIFGLSMLPAILTLLMWWKGRNRGQAKA